MNGVHDIGGMDGFGPMIREEHEPVFHEPWEGRVFALAMVGAGRKQIPVDAFRNQLEQMEPVQYLASSYYERWLAVIEQAIIDAGTLTSEEIASRVRELESDAERELPRTANPTQADGIAAALRSGRPATRKIRKPPRFAIGDRVIARNLNPHGHTRLPRYVRGKRGVVTLHHGAHVFPDTNALGLGENPQHLFTVRFTARELWSDAAEPRESVLIDLWESYLQPDPPAKAASPSKTRIAPNAKSVAKTPVRKPATAKAPKPRRSVRAKAIKGKPAPKRSAKPSGASGRGAQKNKGKVRPRAER
jgi:nitrile hydratase subunit beta